MKKTDIVDLQEKEWFIQAPWGRICIIAWGDCRDPPVLLCHGEADCATTYRPLIRNLPRNFYYIGMEIPGNGRSDPFPPGLMISAYDVVYAIESVVRHFRWNSFVYIAHSLGTLYGKLYNISYPGKMSKVVDLDPTPVYYVIEPEKFPEWYHYYYTKFFKKYHIYNGSKETAPKYTKEEAVAKVVNVRGFSEEIALDILERIAEVLDDDRIRFTFDQRTKVIVRPAISSSHLRSILSQIDTPTLTIAADESVRMGQFDDAPYALDEKAHPSKNYKVVEVTGNHNVHIVHPERVAPFIGQFLLYGIDGLNSKSKL